MKRSVLAKSIAGVALALGMASFAQAATYTPDTLLGSDSLGNSGEATEEAWLEGIVGSDLTYTKVDGVTGFGQDDAGNWFIDVAPNTPGYFLLKFGVGQTGADDTYAFANIGELDKLVWTDADVQGLLENCGSELTECRLSHYGFSGDTTEVPVPGTLGLLGLGLAGLGLVRRKS